MVNLALFYEIPCEKTNEWGESSSVEAQRFSANFPLSHSATKPTPLPTQFELPTKILSPTSPLQQS